MPNNKYLKIDNVTYKVPIIEMKRSGDILDLEAHRLANGDLWRNVIGTYYNFSIQIGPVKNRTVYNNLWRVLTAPVEKHKIQLPNQSDWFYGYFGSVQDTITLVTDDGYTATGLSFNVVCWSPSRRA